MMNITLQRVGLVLVLLAAFADTTTAYAQSRFQGNAFGYVAQDDARQRFNQDRRRDNSQGRGNERRDGADRNAGRQDQGRRDPRLSPDERRALRRQIDEAGRDIYAPRR